MREPHEHLVGNGEGPMDVASIPACKGAGFCKGGGDLGVSNLYIQPKVSGGDSAPEI